MALDPIIRRMHAERVGVTPDTLALIGYSTLVWNGCEIQFQMLISSIAGWKRNTGDFVTVDLQNLSRIQLARNLLHTSHLDGSIVTHCLAVIGLFDAVRIARNGILHGVPAIKPGDDSQHLMVRFEAKQGNGMIKTKELRLTENYAIGFSQSVSLLSVALAHTNQLVRRDNLYRKAARVRSRQSHPEFVWQGAGRGPEEPEIESARELLRLPPQSPT